MYYFDYSLNQQRLVWCVLGGGNVGLVQLDFILLKLNSIPRNHNEIFGFCFLQFSF